MRRDSMFDTVFFVDDACRLIVFDNDAVSLRMSDDS